MRNSTKLIILVVILMILAVVAISENTPGAVGPAKVAYVDIDRLLASTKSWIDFTTNMQTDREFYQNQLDSMSQEYNEMKAAGVSEVDLKVKEKEIFDKKASFESTLNSTYSTKRDVITSNINNRIKDFAIFNGYDLVITKNAVIYGKNVYDVTGSLIDYMKGF